MSRSYCTKPEHQDGQHDPSCLPPADPGDPALRMLRVIFGLCPYCDVEDPHTHLCPICHQDMADHAHGEWV